MAMKPTSKTAAAGTRALGVTCASQRGSQLTCRRHSRAIEGRKVYYGPGQVQHRVRRPTWFHYLRSRERPLALLLWIVGQYVTTARPTMSPVRRSSMFSLISSKRIVLIAWRIMPCSANEITSLRSL